MCELETIRNISTFSTYAPDKSGKPMFAYISKFGNESLRPGGVKVIN